MEPDSLQIQLCDPKDGNKGKREMKTSYKEYKVEMTAKNIQETRLPN